VAGAPEAVPAVLDVFRTGGFGEAAVVGGVDAGASGPRLVIRAPD